MNTISETHMGKSGRKAPTFSSAYGRMSAEMQARIDGYKERCRKNRIVTVYEHSKSLPYSRDQIWDCVVATEFMRHWIGTGNNL